jgi:DNA-binding NtrC family response regulator
MKTVDKVLIVDDDQVFLKTLRKGLKNYTGQFEVMTVSSGAEALKILKDDRISVFITALDMPKMNGLELLSKVEKSRPQVPCVLLMEPENAAIENGADRTNIFCTLTKPLDADELFPVILEGLERIDEGLFWREYRRQ